MSSKPESPITLVVRRGALRRFNKLQKDTANLPVVVTWDRRNPDRHQPTDENGAQAAEERRGDPSFTWELADFIVVPGDADSLRSVEPAGDPVTGVPERPDEDDPTD